MGILKERRRRALRDNEEFAAKIVKTVETATAEAVADGRATVTRDSGPPGDYLTIMPTNPKSCPVTVILDLPTVKYDEATDEMFVGREDERLQCLADDLADVIAGRFVWGYRKRKILGGLLGSFTVKYGEFPDRQPARIFTSDSLRSHGADERHTFEPY